jgi:WD40 repeat protein
MTKLFISYSRKNKEFAGKLNASLKDLGYDSWIDWDDIPPSADWWDQIQKGIEAADSVIFLISPDSIKSEVCGRELEHAVKNGKRILPVVVRDVSPSDVNSVLARLNWVFFREQDDFSSALTKLEASIKTDLVWVEAHRRLQVKALEWEKRQDASLLVRGKDLQDAEHQLALNSSKEPAPTDLQREYVLKSRQAADRQRRLVTMLSIAAAVIMAALAVFGLIQAALASERAIMARSRELAAQSITQRGSNFSAALLLGVEAQTLKDQPLSRGVLWANDQTNLHLIQYLKEDSWVQSVAVSPDGKTLAAGSSLGSITLWDLETRQPLGVLSTGTDSGGVESLAFSPDGRLLAAGSWTTSSIMLWDVSTRQSVGEPIQAAVLGNVLFSPDGQTLAWLQSEDFEKSIVFWNVETGQMDGEPIQLDLDPNNPDVSFTMTCFAFSPDGAILALGGMDGTVQFLDMETRQPIVLEGEAVTGHITLVKSIAFSPDGQTVVTGSEAGDLLFWNVGQLQPLSGSLNGHNSTVNALDFSPDGKTVVSASEDGSLILWDAETFAQLDAPLLGHGSYISDVVFSPDGRFIASGGGDGNVILWNVEPAQTMQFSGEVNSIAISPDGKTLFIPVDDTNSDSSISNLVDFETRQPLCSVEGEGIAVGAAFSPDGTFVAYIANALDQPEIRLINASTCQPEGDPLPSSAGDFSAMSISPDGRTLAVSYLDDGTIQLWDLVSRQPLEDPFDGQHGIISSLAFSPDGNLLASGSEEDGTIVLWDVASLQPVGEPLFGQHDVTSLAFSPDGQSLASGSVDTTVFIWDVQRAELVSQLNSFKEVTSMAYSPDGKLLAVGHQEGTVILLDLETGQAVSAPFKRHTEKVSDLLFSPDGRYLVSGSVDGHVQFWNNELNTWLAAACQRAGRNLSRLEWAQFGFTEDYHATCPQWPLESE